MNEQEKAALYLDKLRLYFIDIPKVIKHLEDVVTKDDGQMKDVNLIGIKAMCSTLYLCIFYINQISIVSNQKDFLALANTIQKVYKDHKPIIDKLNSMTENMNLKEFEEKGLNFVGGNTTLQ